jgi:drug/metabolite transporter (DMT)-like permease
MKVRGTMGIIFAAMGAISYAFMSIAVKLTFNYGYSAYGLLFFQFLLVSILLAALAIPDIRKTEFRKIKIRELVDLSIVGIFLGIMTLTYFFAIEIIPVSLAIVLFFLYPVLIPIFKLVFEREKPPLFVVISLILTFSGVLLGASLTSETLRNISMLGIVLSLCSAVSFALFVYYYDRPTYTLPTLLSTAIVVSTSTIFIALFFPFFPIHHAIDGKFLLCSLIVGILAQLFPVLFLQLAIRRIGAVMVSIIQTGELPLTMFMALLFFQEHMKPVQIVGIILIVAGILYSNVKGRMPEKLERTELSN